MARRREELIPVAVRIALRNAVGGSSSYSLRQIDDLFHSHEFTEADTSVSDAGGQRRTAVEGFQARIDWASPDQARRYLALVSDVLDDYPESGRPTRIAGPGSPPDACARFLLQAAHNDPGNNPQLLCEAGNLHQASMCSG